MAPATVASQLFGPKSGVIQLVRRKTKDPKSLQYLYTFKKDVKIKPSWRFAETVSINVSRNYEQNFSHHINMILE